MKITIEHYGIELTWDNKRGPILDETTIDEIFGAFTGMLIATGWHPDVIESYLLEMKEEIQLHDVEKEEEI